ncbi:MAG TPA: helix-turn-helix domain-containing protein [Natronosporangium sp.]
MDDLAPPSIGRQVATIRKLRGLTQSGLAARLHRSESWVTKVERGERRVDSVSVLAELARALAVPIYELTGYFTAPPNDTIRDCPAGLPELRRLLSLPIVVQPGEPAPVPITELERKVAALVRLYDTATHHVSAVLPRLPGPLQAAQVAVRTTATADRPRAYAALANLYWLAANVLAHSGDLPRAQLASDRALTAAEQSDDPLRIGAIAAFHTVRLATGGDSAEAVAVAVEIADLVARHHQAETPAGTVVLGALYGYGAIAAARHGDRSETLRLLKAAGEAAERLGCERKAYVAHFGPHNLASKELAAMAFLNRPDRAIEAAERVDLHRLGSKMRIGHHCTHLASAHVRRGDDDRALATLLAGLEAAPQVVRYHTTARGLVHDLLHRCRQVDERLRRLAREMNLPR